MIVLCTTYTQRQEDTLWDTLEMEWHAVVSYHVCSRN